VPLDLPVTEVVLASAQVSVSPDGTVTLPGESVAVVRVA
jgi:hypothetical protein